MELAQLESFMEAVRAGSFRRAASAMHVTQPTLSARVQALEGDLGVPLFHRVGRGVRLTAMGKALLPFAERALEALQEGRKAAEAARHTAGGLVNVASARTIGTYILPGIVERFRQQHPKITVHIKTGRSSDVQEMVLREDADVGLARDLKNPEIEVVHLFDEHIVLVTHPKHPFAKRRRATMREVAREPLILYDPGSAYFTRIYEVCREAGIEPRVEMNLDSIEATKRMVALGLGVSFLPRSAIAQELDLGKLSMIPIPREAPITLETCVLLRRAQHYPAAALAFLGVLREMYGVEIPALTRGREG